MTDLNDKQSDSLSTDSPHEESIGSERREFLRSLGKWSQVVVGGVLAGGAITISAPAEAGSWINRHGGGGWVNRHGGGGWGNRGGSWGNRGGGWVNRSNAWSNRGGGWGNRGGGGWGNRGGSWMNR